MLWKVNLRNGSPAPTPSWLPGKWTLLYKTHSFSDGTRSSEQSWPYMVSAAHLLDFHLSFLLFWFDLVWFGFIWFGLVLWVKILLCIPGWPCTYYVAQAGHIFMVPCLWLPNAGVMSMCHYEEALWGLHNTVSGLLVCLIFPESFLNWCLLNEEFDGKAGMFLSVKSSGKNNVRRKKSRKFSIMQD